MTAENQEPGEQAAAVLTEKKAAADVCNATCKHAWDRLQLLETLQGTDWNMCGLVLLNCQWLSFLGALNARCKVVVLACGATLEVR